jgi:hypothetical protein
LSTVAIAECHDSELLALYWHTTPTELGFQESLNLLDRIIENSEADSDRLYYSLIKGIQCCMICEVERGCEIIEGSIARYRTAAGRETSAWGDLQLARALETLGRFKSDVQLVKSAASAYRNLIHSARESGFPDELMTTSRI